MNTKFIEQLKQKLAEAQAKQNADAIRFMTENPNVPFDQVGDKFNFSSMQASRLWAKAGFPARKSGRKVGISPLKREKPTT
jgi:hypothetical protein